MVCLLGDFFNSENETFYQMSRDVWFIRSFIHWIGFYLYRTVLILKLSRGKPKPIGLFVFLPSKGFIIGSNQKIDMICIYGSKIPHLISFFCVVKIRKWLNFWYQFCSRSMELKTTCVTFPKNRINFRQQSKFIANRK